MAMTALLVQKRQRHASSPEISHFLDWPVEEWGSGKLLLCFASRLTRRFCTCRSSLYLLAGEHAVFDDSDDGTEQERQVDFYVMVSTKTDRHTFGRVRKN